jgi:hypothetical protein
VRVGHRQDSIPKPLIAHAVRGFVCAQKKHPEIDTSGLILRMLANDLRASSVHQDPANNPTGRGVWPN